MESSEKLTLRQCFRAWMIKHKTVRYKWEKRIWIVLLIPLSLFLHDTNVITGLSVYALILTAASAEEGSNDELVIASIQRAVEAINKANPETQDIDLKELEVDPDKNAEDDVKIKK